MGALLCGKECGRSENGGEQEIHASPGRQSATNTTFFRSRADPLCNCMELFILVDNSTLTDRYFRGSPVFPCSSGTGM